MRAITVLVALGLAAAPARAEPWYRGPHGHRRVVNLAITAGGAALYAASETFLKADLAPATCRWCSVDGLDADVRSALVWRDPGAARTLSNLDGFVVAPIAGLGLVLLGTAAQRGGVTWARAIDDTVPVLETVVLSQLVVQVVKFSAGRQRPFVHYGAGGPPGLDDNVSFFSGHSALAFGIATSAGVVAHHRGYKTAPYIWGVGMALAASTAYLRIAGDEHYLTDVLAGSAWGVLAGLTVPWLAMRDVEVMPTSNGVALAGVF